MSSNEAAKALFNDFYGVSGRQAWQRNSPSGVNHLPTLTLDDPFAKSVDETASSDTASELPTVFMQFDKNAESSLDWFEQLSREVSEKGTHQSAEPLAW